MVIFSVLKYVKLIAKLFTVLLYKVILLTHTFFIYLNLFSNLNLNNVITGFNRF